MTSFFTSRYHLILLGASVLVAIACAAFLYVHSLDFENSFKNSPLSAKAPAYASPASVNGTNDLELLKKGGNWPIRTDGASPFVSRPYILKEGKLIDPLEGDEPLYPPVPNKWLVEHQLDYTDMNILDRDPRHKGFTVREEFEAGTDPNNPNQYPPLFTKLLFDDSSVRKTTYFLEFQGIEENGGKKEYQIRPTQPLPNPARGGKPDTSSRAVMMGDTIPGVPFLKLEGYQEKKKTIADTEYDFSELTLLNTLTGAHYVLIQKNSSREYRKTPIEIVENVAFNYQLTGVPAETIVAKQGDELKLASLDKKYTETYKLKDVTSGGVILEKDGKTFTLKPSSQNPRQELPPPSPAP